MKEFKTESKKILDMMIHSVYTNKEIFLRELISNASDALDKVSFEALTNKDIKIKKDDLAINIVVDKDKRLITISDNGIGMNKDELENNLGTVAKSGTLDFKEKLNSKNNLIGMFGVGFYSAFMVADKIEVLSKKILEDKSYVWVSKGLEGYDIKEKAKETNGTIITLTIKDGEEYNQFLDEHFIERLITKYSNHILYPIYLGDSTEAKNEMMPIWKKNKKKITEDEYHNFYMNRFMDYNKPLHVIHAKAEGRYEFDYLLYIPSKTPVDFYSKDFEKGLALYSNGVLIMENASDLLPDYLQFVKGVVDSKDLKLNISREILQEDKITIFIKNAIETKVLKELKNLMNEDLEKYKKFFSQFGLTLKFGTYNNFGMEKDKLKDLLLFNSSKEADLISLSDYIKDADDKIYYVAGESIKQALGLPQAIKMIDQGKNILVLTDPVDEFVIKVLGSYEDKAFVNVSSLDTLEEDEETKKENEDKTQVLENLKSYISNYVDEVKFTSGLGEYPVSLSTKGDISIEMEKVLSQMPGSGSASAQKVLLINKDHTIAEKIANADNEELEKIAKVLYASAALMEGLPVDDLGDISKIIFEYMSK